MSLKAGTCNYRSGWELKFLEYLDADPNVVTFQYESLKIEYVSNLRTKKIRRYIPDFFVKYADGRQEVIEIKQLRRVNHPTVIKKAIAAQAWCSVNDATYVIMTEVDLKSLGLL